MNPIRMLMLFLTVFSYTAYADDISSDEALALLIAATNAGDASEISIEIINSVDGITDAKSDFLEDYQEVIANELVYEDDNDDYITELKEYIETINDTPADVAEQVVNSQMTDNWPDSRYIGNNDGTFTDSITNLRWMKCSYGQTWDANALDCIDPENDAAYDLVSLTWAAALKVPNDVNNDGGFAGISTWRLPNINELSSVIARNRYSPAVNSTVLGANYKDWYWTSTPSATETTKSWQVNLSDGNDFAETRSNLAYVILVTDTE